VGTAKPHHSKTEFRGKTEECGEHQRKKKDLPYGATRPEDLAGGKLNTSGDGKKGRVVSGEKKGGGETREGAGNSKGMD